MGSVVGVNLPRPDSNTVIAILIRLDQEAGEVLLDDEERRRAERFVFDRDRRRYVAAHTAVRVMLGRYLEMNPLDVRFVADRRGKPRLANASSDLRFNLSHSEERALLAVALGREVGADIEYMRSVPDMFGVAEEVFSPLERACLQEASSEQRPDVFFRVWTRKESFIKALGDGMHFPLNEFDVSAEPSAPELLLACRAAPSEVGRWTMLDLPGEPGYMATLTVEGSGFEVVSGAYQRAQPPMIK